MKALNLFLMMAALLLLGGNASGQVRKCTGPDGKVTYSDVICASTGHKESGVTVNANTIDGSVLRRQSEQYSDQEAIGQAASAGKCKFAYYTLGDDKGKMLSDDAKAECLQNIVAKGKGQQPSLEAYRLWKDHFEMTSSRRQASSARAQSAENARNIANSNRNAIDAVGNKLGNQLDSKTYNCRPNMMGSALECK